jgi:hypothetical protein
MKKISGLLLAALVGTAVLAGLSGCADVNGLHNQEAAKVTFVFTNFKAAEDGDYTIPGNYNSWAYTSSMVTIKDGEGTSSVQTATSSYLKFTLIKTGDSSWVRSWYPAVKGNAVDESSGNWQNLFADGYSLGTDVTVTVDGSTSPVTVTVK